MLKVEILRGPEYRILNCCDLIALINDWFNDIDLLIIL